MQNISKTAAIVKFFRSLEFTIARLVATPDETGDLAPAVEAMLERGRAVRDAHERAGSCTVRAEANHVTAELSLDGRVRALGRAALDVADGHTNEEPYASLFHGAPSRIDDMPWEEQNAEVARIDIALRGLGPPLDAHAAPIATAQAAVTATVVARTAAEGSEAATADAIGVWKDDANTERRRVFGALTVRFPRDARRVRSYFRRPRKAKRATGAPAGGAAPAKGA